jgi:aspartate/methionine/tyrosine aminotransferase
MNPATATHSFQHDQINEKVLRRTAFNLRWATVEEDVIPLTAGEMDYPICPAVAEAIERHVHNGYLGYCPPQGYESFRNAIANDLSAKGIPASADQVLVIDGAASALKVACRAILNPGDEAVTFDPVDFLLPHCAELAGAKVNRCPVSTTDGSFDSEQLESLITPKTKALLVCNPHNPTGRVLRREELHTLANLAEKHNLVLISDEVWSEIILGERPMISLASLSDETAARTVTVSGFSKSDGLSGLRVGYLHSSSESIFRKIVEESGILDTSGGATALSQVAAEAALLHGSSWRIAFVDHLRQIIPPAAERLSALKGVHCPVPEGTFLLFPKVEFPQTEMEPLAERILKEARVSVVPGAEQWFGAGARGHLRLSVATSREILDEALGRLESFWSSIALTQE